MTPTQRLAALFAGNDSHYGTHGEPEKDTSSGKSKWIIRPTAKTLKGAVTEQHWKNHMAEGSVKPLGVVPIRNDNRCLWGSIDYDVYDVDLTDLIKKVEAAKLPLLPARTKSGGLHLFFFALEPVPAKQMQELLRSLAAQLGIAGSEIFPKQTTLLVERGETGSWIIMPYFGGDFGGKLKVQVGLRANGGEIPLAEFVRTAEKMRQTPSQIEEILIAATTAKPKSAPGSGSKRKSGGKGPSAADEEGPFGDGPPCLMNMVRAGGVKSGGQNDALCHMATYYKKKNPDTWKEELARANELYLSPPGSKAGLDSVIKGYSKKDYEYKCKHEPMKSACDSITCRRKQFGVTGGNVVPLITSMKMLKTDPPIWFIDLEGEIKIECSTEDLQRWERFQKLLMEKAHNPFGIVPHPLWIATVGIAMQKVEVIEVGADAGISGEFRELLETFLTNKQRALREEDLLSGRPWEDEEQGRYYFSLGKLQRYLKREGMEKMDRAKVTSRLKEIGGVSETRVVKDKALHLHWVPSSVVRGTPQISTPDKKEKPI
jgi:hypothetical protein